MPPRRARSPGEAELEAQVEALASELRRRRESNEALAERTREQALRLLHTFSPDEVDGFVAGLMTNTELVTV